MTRVVFAKNEYDDIKLYESAFVQLIRKRFGIALSPNQYKEMHKTVADACTRFNMILPTYLQQLGTSPENSTIMQHFVNGVTLGETYFFRDKNQMRLLETSVLPHLIRLKLEQKKTSLKVWSAGSSSGEEIYTIAMMLNELLPNIKGWSLDLFGSDINGASLEKATKGYYTNWSMRSIGEYYKKRYFKMEDNQYELSPDIRKLVRFIPLNLHDDTYPSLINGTQNVDLILCRNVLIYFDNESTAKIMRQFNKALAPEGILILGASDPVDISETSLVLHHEAHSIYFSKRPETSPELKSSIANIQKSEQASVIKIQEKTAGDLVKDARLLYDQGKFKEAEILCAESIGIDPTHVQSYFTYAQVLMGLNRVNEAELALRKTLFLDHDFIAGYYELGLLLLRDKKDRSGFKKLENALDLAEKRPKSETVPELHDLSCQTLVKIIRKKIAFYLSTGGLS